MKRRPPFCKSRNALSLFAMVVFALMGCNTAKVEIPDSYEQWNSKDGSFALDFPAGWMSKGNGNNSSGIAWAEFTEAGARIRIDALFGDAIKGDLANMSGGLVMVDEEDADFDMTREEIVHKHGKEYYEDKYQGYAEEDGVSMRIKLGPAYISGFAAQEGFSQIKGIRATVTTTNRGVTFFASCPANQWDEFKPVFIHCLKSMKRGVEEF